MLDANEVWPRELFIDAFCKAVFLYLVVPLCMLLVQGMVDVVVILGTRELYENFFCQPEKLE